MKIYETFLFELSNPAKKKVLIAIGIVDNIKKGAARNYLKNQVYLKDLERLKVLAETFTNGSIDTLLTLCQPCKPSSKAKVKPQPQNPKIVKI